MSSTTTSSTTTTTIITLPAVEEEPPVDKSIIDQIATDETIAIVNGKPADMSMNVANGTVSLEVASATFHIIATDKAGTPLKIDESGRVFLNDTRSFGVSAAGLIPKTQYEIWLYSTPMKLGKFMTSINGSHTANISLPENAEEGWHNIVFTGRTITGAEISVSGRLRVPTDTNIVIDLARSTWVWVLVVGAIFFALLLPGRFRSRRK
ncbi:MAG: hypothetical protein ACO3JF_09200 [Ilumatobacteraceae bacterium]